MEKEIMLQKKTYVGPEIRIECVVAEKGFAFSTQDIIDDGEDVPW